MDGRIGDLVGNATRHCPATQAISATNSISSTLDKEIRRKQQVSAVKMS